MTRKTVGIIGVAEVSAGGAPSQRAADAYPIAVARMTGAVPLIIPALPQTQDIGHLLENAVYLELRRRRFRHGSTRAPQDRPCQRRRRRVSHRAIGQYGDLKG